MRILIPYAGWLPGAADDLPLPALHTLLSKMQLLRQDSRLKSHFFYLKHELEEAAAYGFAGAEEGRLPRAALQRQQLGLSPRAGEIWGRVSLCHWQIGMNDGQLRPGGQLALDAAEADAIWGRLAPLLAEHGLQLEPYPVLPPYARHVRVTGAMADLACASVERVAGQELSDYLPRALPGSAAGQLQSLLAEVQMLLYQDPVNDARAARRLPALNSLWLDGVGALPADFVPAELEVVRDLQQAAERADLQAWRAAWQHIEGERLPAWQAALDAGEFLELHLCGLQTSAVFQPAQRGLAARCLHWWQTRGSQANKSSNWPAALSEKPTPE